MLGSVSMLGVVRRKTQPASLSIQENELDGKRLNPLPPPNLNNASCASLAYQL
ncbi:MAG: hypothetical protein ABIJ65_01560 [Chloroflexota bacterium]